MRNLKLTLQYMGTAYCGWQVQPNGPTVQSVLQEILEKTLQEKVTLHCAGRTDSGVHALGQVAAFKTKNTMDPKTLRLGLNSQLPPDISVLDLVEVPQDFHPMRAAKNKTYTYLLHNSRHQHAFLGPFTWRRFGHMDRDIMKDALEMLRGEHDFAAFCASDTTAKTTLRRIEAVRLQQVSLDHLGNSLMGLFGLQGLLPALDMESFVQGDGEGEFLLAITLQGPGFLKHMVRNIVGTLVDVGQGRTNLEDFNRILKSRDRRQAGITAPPQGLFMVKVEY